MAIPRASVAVVLLAALVAALLYPDSVRQHLPLSVSRAFAPRDATSSSSDATSSVSNGAAASTVPLDYDALRAYVDANSQSALRWGTYRSGLYFGVRSRSHPFFVASGLLWGSQHEDISQLRHECRQDDRLQKYGWLEHDGRSYGLQRVEDQFNRIALQSHYIRLAPATEDVASGVDGWAARFDVAHLEPRDERLRKKRVERTKLSLFFYLELGCEDESLGHACRHRLKNVIDVAQEPATQSCEAVDSEAGDDDSATCTRMAFESDGVATADNPPLRFRVDVQLRAKRTIRHAELRYSGLKDTNILNVKERLQALAERAPGADDPEILLDNIIDDDSTLVVVQAIVDADVAAFAPGDVALDVVLNELAVAPASDNIDALVTRAIAQRSQAFHERFAAAFQLSTKGVSSLDGSSQAFNAVDVAFAQAAFSNLIGGVGYFYGSSLVQHDANDPTVVEASPKPLFTAVPSRSFFPRGFLWDEGFHQIGIAAFDDALARDVIVHWLGLMEDDGYIAREQILGQSARRRVPNEFLVQHVEHANPPSLLLCIEKMLARAAASSSSASSSSKDAHDLDAFVRLVFPFLERWYHWLLRTQRGPIVTDALMTFRWRGRRADDGKLIANTLSSGLDDYPRASTPSANEMHVDLLAWMIKASDVMAQLARVLERDATAFEADNRRFRTALDAVHWSDAHQSFFDVGDHSEDGRIDHRVVVRCRNDATGAIVDTTAPVDDLQRRDVQCPASHPTFLFPLGDGSGGLKMQQIFVPGTVRPLVLALS